MASTTNGIRDRKPTRFYHDIRPMLKLMKLCGLFPVKILAAANNSTKIDYLFLCYSTTLYAIILYNIAFIYKHSVPRLIDARTAFNSRIYICVNLIIVHLFTLVPYTHWIYYKTYMKHIFAWQRLLQNYENLFDVSLEIRTRKCIFTGIAAIFAMIVVLGGVLAYGMPHKLYVAFEMCGIVTILTSSGTLWYQMCNNAHTVADDFTKRLRRLADVTKQIGEAFTKLISFSILLTIMSGVLAAFGQIIKILRGYPPNNDTLMSSFFAVSDSYNLYTICNVSYKAVESIETFLQTMKISNPHIYLAGFIKINRKLLVKIYSTLTTCMIVLTQFQLTMPYDMD